jgi:NADH-quinone oxidoreductase subunit K
MKIELIYYLLFFLPLSTVIAGIAGLLLWRKNLVLTIIALEICFIGANIGFVLSSILIDDTFGFIFSLVGLTLAGAEVSLGLALTIIVYRRFDNIYTKNLVLLKS